MSNTAITQSSMFGIGPGVGQGMWTLVERKEFVSAATSHTFSGLNGNADRRYKLVMRLVNAVTGSYFIVQLHGDTGNNYVQQFLGWSGSSVNAAGTQSFGQWGMPCGYTDGSGLMCFSEGVIDAASGTSRTGFFSFHRATSPSANGQTINSHWTNTSDNITSLKVISLVSNGMGVGSYIELWRLSS